jgi:hypothetical protein
MLARVLDILLALVWLPLALSSWLTWEERRAPLAIPLLVVNALIVLLFLCRRPSR